MKKNLLIYIAIFSLLTGCTYSISMVHTEGSASDVIDETQSAHPSTDANLTIPLSPF